MELTYLPLTLSLSISTKFLALRFLLFVTKSCSFGIIPSLTIRFNTEL